MAKITKRIIIIISIVILNSNCLQYFSVPDLQKDYYNFKNIRPKFNLGLYNIKIEDNKMIFNKAHGIISSPTEYNNLSNEFNFNNIYQIKDSLQNVYYFRFGWVSYEENQTLFSNIQWLKNIKPKEFKSFTDFEFSVVEIDFIQFGKKTLCTIGDSQTWYSKAQHLRTDINAINEDLIFIGTNTDIFGYGHEGEGGNSTDKLLSRMHNIPKADYYTLLIGTNDYKGNIDTSYSNILEITNHIKSLNPEALLFYLTPIPTKDKDRDDFNKNLSRRLLAKFNGSRQIIVLDLGKKMRENKDWEVDYLGHDGLHQNTSGVQFMARLIGEKTKGIK